MIAVVSSTFLYSTRLCTLVSSSLHVCSSCRRADRLEANQVFWDFFDRGHQRPIFNCALPDLLPTLPTGFMWSLRLHERHRFSTRPFVLHFIYGCYLQHWTHQSSFTRFGRKFCRTLLCRARTDIFSTLAMKVCLMGHTAVRT